MSDPKPSSGATGGAAAPPPGAGPGEPGAPMQVLVPARPDRGWVPVAVAAGLAGFALVLLHIPGVLQYPTYPVQPVVEPQPVRPAANEAQRLAAERERNAALREQIVKARRLLEQNVCIKDGEPFVPVLPLPGQKESGQGGGLRPVTPTEDGGLTGRPAEKIRLGPNAPAAPGFEGNLVELLEKATVLVLSPPSGRGSGFFIAPGKIVTNRHVVAANPTGEVYVTNRQLGRVRKARIVSRTPEGERLAPDYALLELEGPADTPALALGTDIGRLQRVVAAGFPGIVTLSDEKNAALMGGDATAIPEMAVTQGAVTVVQNRESGRPIVGHEATISPGSSGGPLVDECGRVVGVNTFGLFDETGRYRANYAQGVGSLIAFLEGAGVTPTVVREPCRVENTRTAATPTPPASPDGSAAPAPVTPTRAPVPPSDSKAIMRTLPSPAAPSRAAPEAGAPAPGLPPAAAPAAAPGAARSPSVEEAPGGPVHR